MSEFFGTIPFETWIGLLGVFLGSMMSILGVWLSNRSNLNQLYAQFKHEQDINKKDLNRERLEELYVLFSDWLSMFACICLSEFRVIQGDISYDNHLDNVINMEPKYDFNRLEMIVYIYGHSLKPEYQKVIEARAELNEISAKFKDSYKSGDVDSKKYLEPHIAAQLKIEKYGEELKTAIANLAKSV